VIQFALALCKVAIVEGYLLDNQIVLTGHICILVFHAVTASTAVSLNGPIAAHLGLTHRTEYAHSPSVLRICSVLRVKHPQNGQ